MNIELKNIKYFAAMSEETHCFTATIYVDGKRTFGVSNRGYGGCDDYEPLGKMTQQQMYDKLEEINNELKKETVYFGENNEHSLTNDLELVTGDLMNQYHTDKDIKRTLKKMAYVKDGSIWTSKALPTPENLVGIKRAKWWKDEYILLNGLPIEEIRQYFK